MVNIAITLEEEEAWKQMEKNRKPLNDYADPLLTLRHMLKDYEALLIDKKWSEALALGPDIVSQARLLTQTVRIQAEEQRL